MKRIYHHYELWEDFRTGLYLKEVTKNQIKDSKTLLQDVSLLLIAMEAVIIGWPFSSSVNLSNDGKNRQAWLGQAACCLNHGASENSTKQAWNLLSSNEQISANLIADSIIEKWESLNA